MQDSRQAVAQILLTSNSGFVKLCRLLVLDRIIRGVAKLAISFNRKRRPGITLGQGLKIGQTFFLLPRLAVIKAQKIINLIQFGIRDLQIQDLFTGLNASSQKRLTIGSINETITLAA